METDNCPNILAPDWPEWLLDLYTDANYHSEREMVGDLVRLLPDIYTVLNNAGENLLASKLLRASTKLENI